MQGRGELVVSQPAAVPVPADGEGDAASMGAILAILRRNEDNDANQRQTIAALLTETKALHAENARLQQKMESVTVCKASWYSG